MLLRVVLRQHANYMNNFDEVKSYIMENQGCSALEGLEESLRDDEEALLMLL